VKAIIMAGGQGTRCWPWSIKEKPKQFLSIHHDKTMIQATYDRFRSWLPKEKIYVVTTEKYSPHVLEQLPELVDGRMILEPEQRDTAPCIALTAKRFLDQGDDEPLVVSPSDHYISNEKAFKHALLLAENKALAGNSIVTLGIRTLRPETGYGYIEAMENEDAEVVKVKTFIEKPSYERAVGLYQRPNVYWNSGIFVWKPSTIAYYMEKNQPGLWRTLMKQDNNLEAAYATLPKISIDYAVLEKADEVYMIPALFQWDDLGTWQSLERLYSKDGCGNVALGDIHSTYTKNCMVYSEDRQVMTLGVEDLIIVSTEEGLLVCHKSREQDIKKALKERSDWEDGN
jgi:mannose-1-phosphate guanylyltransferase